MTILQDKTALITGATGGLGEQIAYKLAEKGCNLYLLGRDEGKLIKLNSSLKKVSSAIKIKNIKVDFLCLGSVQGLLNKNLEIDILINCAGVFPIKNLCESTLKEYDKCFGINVKAPFILSTTYAEVMKKNNWGRIINIGSSSSYNGSGDTGLYCASKHALLGLSRSLYQELKPYNVRVYMVSPGSIQTNMGATDTRQDFSTFLNPEEVADYIVYIMKFDDELISEEIRLNRMIVQ